MVVCFAVSVLLLVILFVILRAHNKAYEHCSVDVQGVVVDNVIRKGNDEDLFFPVIEYEYKGKTYKQQSSDSENYAKYGADDVMTLHINPDDPKEFYIQKSDSSAVSALLLLSGAFAVLGVMLVIVNVKSKRNERNSAA